MKVIRQAAVRVGDEHAIIEEGTPYELRWDGDRLVLFAERVPSRVDGDGSRFNYTISFSQADRERLVAEIGLKENRPK